MRQAPDSGPSWASWHEPEPARVAIIQRHTRAKLPKFPLKLPVYPIDYSYLYSIIGTDGNGCLSRDAERLPPTGNRSRSREPGGSQNGTRNRDPQPSPQPSPSALSPQPSALSPQPSALSPQPSPSALSPQPQPEALSPQPSALSPQPSALSPQPARALSPQPSALSPQPSALALALALQAQALRRAFQRATVEKLYALPVAGTDRAVWTCKDHRVIVTGPHATDVACDCKAGSRGLVCKHTVPVIYCRNYHLSPVAKPATCPGVRYAPRRPDARGISATPETAMSGAGRVT